jgi:hypothetical protein
MTSAIGVYSVSSHSEARPYLSGERLTFTRSSRDLPEKKKRELQPEYAKGPFAPNTHNLSMGVGQFFLLGKLSNNYENAIGPELNYTYGVSDLFSFQTHFAYHSHSSGAFSAWNLAAGLRANLMYFDQLVPFASVGLGFFNPTFTLADSATVSGLLFGMQIGTGIDLMISNRVFFGAKMMYHNMFDSSKKDSKGNLQDLGGAFASFTVHAGLTF